MPRAPAADDYESASTSSREYDLPPTTWTSSSSSSSRRKDGSRLRSRIIIALLVILGLFLLGTIIVLSTVQAYFGIPDWAYITEAEIGGWDPSSRIAEFQKEGAAAHLNGSLHTVWEDGVEWSEQGKGSGAYWMRADWDGTVNGTDDWRRLDAVDTRSGERIPRLIHQTWKSSVLPPKWRDVWRECREGMPDYEYMLWTDELSRQFIATEYPSFLAMYDGYEYPIQRADAIRYFVLHKYGGVYMDLDIGCRRRLDTLLQADWDVLLPRTKPVGVSNDLIFSSRRSPFMDMAIHGLAAFDHRYLTNYPTVMFSTGPMFLSAQYGLYTSAHPLTPAKPRAEVRILPKSLYGKNAKPGEAPHAFFSHFYGSSWHADDAGFITFLGTSGKLLMYVGFIVLIGGAARFLLARRRRSSTGTGGRRGDYQMVSILPTNDPNRSPSLASDASLSLMDDVDPSKIARAVKRAGHLVLAAPAALFPSRRSRGQMSGILYFLPTRSPTDATTSARRPRTASSASQLPRRDEEPLMDPSLALASGDKAPPPYHQESL